MKIIDVLNKMADGTLEDGFEFKLVNNGSDTFTYNKENGMLKSHYKGDSLGELVALEFILNNEIEVIEKADEIGRVMVIGSYATDIPAIADKLNEVIYKLNRLIESEK